MKYLDKKDYLCPVTTWGVKRTLSVIAIAVAFAFTAGLAHAADNSRNGWQGPGLYVEGDTIGDRRPNYVYHATPSDQDHLYTLVRLTDPTSPSAANSNNNNSNNNRNSNRNTNRNNNTNTNVGVNVQGQSVNNKQTIAPSQEVRIENPRQAVSAAGVSAAGTTATCRIAGGASVGAVWGGFSFSGSVVDENCVALEIAKAAIWAGSNTGDADLVQIGTHIIREQAKALVGPAKAKAEAAVSSTTPFVWEMDSSN